MTNAAVKDYLDAHAGQFDAESGAFDQVADGVDTVVGGGVEFVHVETGALGDRHARGALAARLTTCLLYTSPSPRDRTRSRKPSSAWTNK